MSPKTGAVAIAPFCPLATRSMQGVTKDSAKRRYRTRGFLRPAAMALLPLGNVSSS